MQTPSVIDICNEWRLPVYTFGPGENHLRQQIENNQYLKDINPNDWESHCQTIEAIQGPILTRITDLSRSRFDGLEFETSFVRFGSARDGLKVIDALEFDCILDFKIRGMTYTWETVEDIYGQEKLGLIKVKVKNPYELMENMPWLKSSGTIEFGNDGSFYLNTKKLQMNVLMSLVDQTRQHIKDRLQAGNREYDFRRSGRPLTLDIHITLNDKKGITDLHEDVNTCLSENIIENMGLIYPTLAFDIVPALLLRKDTIPNPYNARSYPGKSVMICPVYALMKWAHKSSDANLVDASELLWRECTSSYENIILDISRRNDSQKYLMTACRILKTYVKKQPGHVQLHSVAASQCLKTLCFYCILFLTIPSGTNSIKSVQEALGYLLFCLKLCIENGNLPHFFFGNPYLEQMFPNSSFYTTRTRNLYSPFEPETFLQAKQSFDIMLDDLEGLYIGFDEIDIDRIGRFKEHLGLRHEYRKTDIDGVTGSRISIVTSCAVFLLNTAFILLFLVAYVQTVFE